MKRFSFLFLLVIVTGHVCAVDWINITADLQSNEGVSVTSIPFNAASSDEPESISVPPLKMLIPRFTLTEEGWTLAKTIKEEDRTCEYYVKEIDDEEDSLFTYRKGDGEFITYKKNRWGNNVIGDYKWTNSSGIMVLHQGNINQYIYANGVVEQETVYRNGNNEKILYLPDNQEKGYIVPKEYPSWFYNSLPEAPKYFDDKVRDNREGGFLVEDRLCYLKDDGSVVPYMQKVNGRFFAVCPTDTIVDIKYEKKDTINGKENITFEAIYKNGDRFKYAYKGIGSLNSFPVHYQVATLHRMGGILKINKKKKPVITMDDGTTIQIDLLRVMSEIKDGHFRETNDVLYAISSGQEYDEINSFSHKEDLCEMLRVDSYIWDGIMTYPDGKTEKYEKGLPMSYWDKIEKEEQAKKQAQNAAELAQKRDPYIKKYGFYPGDYKNLKDIIKPGRPFGAIEEYFICKLNKDLGAKKQYKVFVLNSLTNNNLNSTVYVWVQNGKITSVSW